MDVVPVLAVVVAGALAGMGWGALQELGSRFLGLVWAGTMLVCLSVLFVWAIR